MASDPIVPVVIPLPALAVGTDVVQVPVPKACEVLNLSGGVGASLKALVSGTFSANLKNDAGGTLATLSWTAAGLATVTTGAVTRLAAGDHIHVNIVGLGVGADSCAITLWLKMPAHSQ